MIHKTVMMKKCLIWNKEYHRHRNLRKNFVIERIPELVALKADAVFASLTHFSTCLFFSKASLRVDMYHCMGQF